MEINFHFDNKETKDRLTWEDLETIEMMQEGEVSARRLRPFMARFMVDANKKYLPHKQAMMTLGKLTQGQIEGVIRIFTDAIAGTAIPNGNGRLSKPLTEAALPASASPIGQEHLTPLENGGDLPGKSTDEETPPGGA